MALDTFLPEFFSQEFERPEMFEFPYIMFARDRSALVPAGGNQATWPDVEGSVTTQKYVRGTDMTDGEGQDEILTLHINQFDSVAIPLDDVDRTQKMPNLMGEYMIQANRELMWEINVNNRSELRKATRRKASGMTEPMRGNHAGLASNVYPMELLTTDGTGNAHNKIDTPEGRAEIIRAFDQKAGAFAKRHGWVSQNADTKGVAICPIELAEQLREFLWNDKPNMGYGNVVDSAFGLGRILKVQGWEIMEDVTAPELDLANAANNIIVDFLHPQGRSLNYGKQLMTIETERIQKQFGNRLKALYAHGAVQGAARHQYAITINLSDS